MPELPLSDEETSIMLKSALASDANGNGHREIKSLNDAVQHLMKDAPTCPSCGHVAVRNGACFKCLNCGESLGCS